MKHIRLALILCLFLLPALAGLADTVPPAIPQGTLSPLDIQLPRGLKLPVFTGPGEEYVRAANGKAALSTNDWVQVFGRENGWLLIQYGINDAQLRFGYIQVDDLPDNIGADADFLSLWEDTVRTLFQPVILTDDPLASQTQLALFPKGGRVRYLGTIGEWAYVEAIDGDLLLRGFIQDAALTPDTSRDESIPFDLRAVSWGPMSADYATMRYFYDEDVGRLTNKEGPAPNVWLRLDSKESRKDLETLSNFRVISGRASCAPSLVPLYAVDSQANGWLTLHFLPKDGFNRGALDITLAEGESIDNITIACTRIKQNGQDETITLPLAGLPEDSGCPTGGASFTLLRYSPFARTAEQMAEAESYYNIPATLGGVLEDAFQPMPDAPADVLALPYDTPKTSFYLLEGQIVKQHGPFGVYDVTFSLDNPPQGVWLAAYQQSDISSEINAFDMMADGVSLPDGLSESYDAHAMMPETLERDFSILLLVRHQGRDVGEIDRLIKDLNITAAFSAEKWNMSYEQDLVTSAIGPRSAESISMQGLSKGEGILHTIP